MSGPAPGGRGLVFETPGETEPACLGDRRRP